MKAETAAYIGRRGTGVAGNRIADHHGGTGNDGAGAVRDRPGNRAGTALRYSFRRRDGRNGDQKWKREHSAKGVQAGEAG